MTARESFSNDPHLDTVEPSMYKFKSKKPPNLKGWGAAGGGGGRKLCIYIYIYIYDFKLDISITHVSILTYKFCFE